MWFTVVGVSSPVLHHALDGDPDLDLYVPFTQSSTGGPYYALRTVGDSLSVAKHATAIISRIDPNQSFLDVQTMEQRIQSRIWQRRLTSALLAAFAVLALALAAIGLYGVLSYTVTQQTAEFGVRVALGATPRDILRVVFRKGFMLLGLGAAFGLVGAFGLSRLISGLLFQVRPLNIPTFGLATLALMGIAAIACYMPARRATRIDPINALRRE
jgi:putative ABC transport system permease protein